jgi:hypothetical protein
MAQQKNARSRWNTWLSAADLGRRDLKVAFQSSGARGYNDDDDKALIGSNSLLLPPHPCHRWKVA